MAKEIAEAKAGKGKGLQKWDSELAKYAKEDSDREQAPTGQFISVKGGRISIGGNVIKGDELNVIVLDHIYENDFFQGKYDPKKPQTPACFALARNEDDLKPHEKSTAPQHEQCKGCENNEFGSAAKGKGKACKNSRRLAILSADGLDADGVKTGNVMYLRLPVTSVKGWAFFVKGLASNMGMPVFGVVTTIGVVPDDKDQFKVTFAMKEPVDKKMIPALLARRKEMTEAIMFPYTAVVTDESEGKSKKADKKGGKKAARKF